MSEMNLYQKIAKIKGEMAKAKLPKTGYNNYTKFSYFQLDDFEPILEKLCSDYGVVTFFQFENDSASMTVVNADNPDQMVDTKCPAAISGKTGNAMQDIGAMQTYARRYLFMSFFGITESDTLDAVLGKDEPERQQKSIQNKPVTKEQPQPSNTHNTDVDFMSVWKKVMKSFGYDSTKAKQSDTNKNALSEAKNLVSQRYGKESITDLTKEQVEDLDAYISKGPESFESDEIPA